VVLATRASTLLSRFLLVHLVVALGALLPDEAVGGGARVAVDGSQPAAPDSLFLGQRVPGRVPEVFAPGVISDAGFRLHGSPVFCPGLREVYWSVVPPVIMSASFVDGRWTEPAPVPLPGRGVQAPAFSADGTRLYYQGVLEGGRGSVDIWWVERTRDGWGTPVNAGPTVNSGSLESQPSLTVNGTLYFTGTLEGGGFDRGIYRSCLADSGYASPELLGGGINSEFIDYFPWISVDESYLLFASSRPSADEVMHLHVSFRQTDGSWSEPVNIHPVLGFEEPARSPTVSPDGRFLFFLSGGRVYWVDIAGVMELREYVEQGRDQTPVKDADARDP
jgi:hypothetical protein